MGDGWKRAITAAKATRQTPFDEGRQAALRGRTLLTNPYPAGDKRRAEWHRGWHTVL